MTGGAFLSLLNKNPKAKEDRRVFNEVLSNMAAILLTNDALREMWIYNTWRLMIATGGFATLIPCMIGAAMVGTAIFPGAGTIAGLGFGVIGALVATDLPTPIKDALDFWYQRGESGLE